MPIGLLDRLQEKILILDGAMGTSIHLYDPSEEDWGGREKINLCDYIAVTHPEWIYEIHAGFLDVGCDAIETNTFNGSKLVLAEFGLADQVKELNRRNIQIAKDAARAFSTPSQPRFVIGSVGPGTKQPSITDPSIAISFDELYDSYKPQMESFVEEGVDAVLIETCFDILQAKCALICALDAMKAKGVKIPLMVQVTILQNGTMLAGSDMQTAITTLEAFKEVDVIGMNCALGPQDMLSHIQVLSKHCSRWISCLPNAGLPEMVDGKAFFPLCPADLSNWLQRFVEEYGVNIIGGCCGTTHNHLRHTVESLRGVKPRQRQVKTEPSISSLHSTFSLHQEPRPLLVGERTNTNGSRQFKRLLEAEDWNGLVEMAIDQEKEGVHVIDVCTAFVGRDEVRDMREVVRRVNELVRVPLMIDSTETPVLDTALKLISGKAIINSINLEEGRKKIDQVVPLAKRYGAALVALTIDEEGQATTAEWKFRVAKRIYDICTQEYDIPPTDLLFDTLVFPVTTGQEDLRNSAVETLESIRRIKQELPGALTHIGLSNVSFGLTPYVRQVVNSVFLHYALEYGLDSAILHAAKIIPLSRIDDTGRELARRLIFNDRVANDPLQELINHYGDKKAEGNKSTVFLGETVEERLKQAIIQGRRQSLLADLEEARSKYSPLAIINDILLDGMKVVGDLFASGQMQLPFVLQSAEVMKVAVSQLEPYMEKVQGTEKGKIVLATVKGDVHDIGKNLVDIILSNNGYKVINLGIKQPIENMIRAYQEHQADALGMSGLLVKSTVIMKEDLLALNERGLNPPVILGGAALTRRYVEHDLRNMYRGSLYYGEDAFGGLHIMDKIMAEKRLLSTGSRGLSGLVNRNNQPKTHLLDHFEPAATSQTKKDSPTYSTKLPLAKSIPQPTFFGARVRTDIPLAEVYKYINERTLFSTQWQFRKNRVSPKEYQRQMREEAYPALAKLKQWCLEENILQPKVVYGFFPCRAEKDDLVIYDLESKKGKMRFSFPRQNYGDYLCLSDYHRGVDPHSSTPLAALQDESRSGRVSENGNGNYEKPSSVKSVLHPLEEGWDVVAFMAVTVGHEVTKRAWELKEKGEFKNYLYLHGLGVETAEALAEYTHQLIRKEWGIAQDDSSDIHKLFKKHYQGCRYSFGYPACPNLEDQSMLFELLNPERIGLTLSEQFQLEPEQSTTALIVHHPEAKYFNITRSAKCFVEE